MESAAVRHQSPALQSALRLVHDLAETLPDPLSSFVGREPELADIARLLEGARLLTLTGVGGSGKTRLSIETARRAHARFADGVCWVELAPVEDPALLATAVLSALGERAQAGRAVGTLLSATLADRELLLVLDNCEHLVADCANLTAALLRAAPRLRVLASSREALGVPGELVWPVPALPPDTAVQLFLERARAASPAFRITPTNTAAVSEICRRLEGLPFAIELAAARTTVLTPEQIAERLHDALRLLAGGPRAALPHQRTLRATLDWSYALLSRAERVLLARLSVFAGGCTLAAAEAVCGGDELPSADVLQHLSALVDRSLVLAEPHGAETRYRLLETVRQYAAERLESYENGHIVRDRHAEHYAAAAERAAVERYGPERDARATLLQADLDNVRAALRWSDGHRPDLFVRLAFGLGWCYFAWGLWTEGRDWLERALSLPAGARRGAERARALGDLAYMANYQCDFARARPAFEEAMEIWGELGDPRELALTQQMFAQMHLFAGGGASLEAAARLAADAEETLRAAGDRLGVSWASATLGGVHAALGDDVRSVAAYDQARRLAYEAGHAMTVAIGAMGMASIAIKSGDLPRAAALLREALAAHRQAPEYMFLAWTIECTALYAAARGCPGDAMRLLGADESLRRHAGAVISIETTQPAVFAHVTATARQALGDASYESALDDGRRFDLQGTLALAEAVVSADAEHLRSAATDAPALRIRSLGSVRVERHGEAVPLAEWKYAKARELLFLLLLHPEGRTREQIGLALWPEASPEQLRNNLHPVLHHLRRVLGDADWVVHDGGVYRFDRSRHYEFDAETLDHLITAAANLDPEAAVAQLARAVALYGGDFLEQDPPARDWHVARQDALRHRYLDALATLGTMYTTLQWWREAADTWRQLIVRDDLNEMASRALMHCLEQLGERREALRVYDRLVTVLRDELDADPAAETVAVFERLKGSAAV